VTADGMGNGGGGRGDRADDESWTDMDLLASYTAAREELDGLLAQWEVLFAEAQAGAAAESSL